jgi:hypothetical protein
MVLSGCIEAHSFGAIFGASGQLAAEFRGLGLTNLGRFLLYTPFPPKVQLSL